LIVSGIATKPLLSSVTLYFSPAVQTETE